MCRESPSGLDPDSSQYIQPSEPETSGSWWGKLAPYTCTSCCSLSEYWENKKLWLDPTIFHCIWWSDCIFQVDNRQWFVNVKRQLMGRWHVVKTAWIECSALSACHSNARVEQSAPTSRCENTGCPWSSQACCCVLVLHECTSKAIVTVAKKSWTKACSSGLCYIMTWFWQIYVYCMLDPFSTANLSLFTLGVDACST
jgi:hypothetical protein